jgi:FlaG/FlaF family flagellin (archaellin)
MRKLFRSRRAVSPVVSAVLMMLVVMIGMSFLFAFFVNYTVDFQTGSGSAVLESMVIEDVSFTGSNEAQVWVYNVGKVDFNITSVYVNDILIPLKDWTLVQVTYRGADIVPLPDKIRDGAHAKITVGRSFDSGHYVFKIVTERGTSVEGGFQR